VQQRLDHARGSGDHVLAGVQHQQQRPVGERLRHALCRSLTATKLQSDRCGNRGGNQAGIGERRKLGQPHAAGKVRQYLVRGRERELRFADAARPGQRDQPMGANEAHDLRDLSIRYDLSRSWKSYRHAVLVAIAWAHHVSRSRKPPSTGTAADERPISDCANPSISAAARLKHVTANSRPTTTIGTSTASRMSIRPLVVEHVLVV
jgi:hypothetical protein